MAGDLNVAVKITADAAQAASEVDRAAQAVDGLGRQADQAASSISKLNNLGTVAGVGALAINELTELFGRLSGTAGELMALADQFSGLSARLKLAAGDGKAFAFAFDEVRRVANETGSSLDATANLYGTLTRATKDLGLSQQQVAKLTETISQSFAVSGTSAESARNAITQFSQALSAGALRGDEFNSVVEQSPRLAQALAEGLGVSIGALRQLAADGKLTAQVITEALASQSAKIAAEFGQLPRTIGQAMQAAKNEFMIFVGELDKAHGISAGVAKAIDGVAHHVDTLGKIALTVGEVALAGLAAKVVAAFAASGKAVADNLAAMRAKQAADVQAAQAAAAHAEAEKQSAHATLQAAQARQAAAQAALIEAQAALKAAADAGIYGAQRAAAERAVTAARNELTAATTALTAAERANMAATQQLVQAKAAATTQAGLLSTALKGIGVVPGIMLAVAAFEALAAAGHAAGEAVARLSGDVRQAEAAMAAHQAALRGTAQAQTAIAESLKQYATVTALTTDEVARLDATERVAYEQRLTKAVQYHEAALKAANASAEVGIKSQYSAEQAAKALADLRTGFNAIREVAERGMTSIGAQGEAAAEKLRATFNTALVEAEKKAQGAQAAMQALAETLKRADLASPAGILGLALALEEVERRGILASEVIDKQLAGALKNLDAGELAAFRANAEYAFSVSGKSAAALANIIDAVLRRAIEATGQDFTFIATGADRASTEAIGHLDILIGAIGDLKARGLDAGRAIEGALLNALREVGNAQELEAVRARIEQLGAAGIEAGARVEKAFAEAKRRVEDLTPGIQSVNEAFRVLGMKSPEELRKIAETAKEAFETIRSSGEATPKQVAEAFRKYAGAAIAANGGVADSALKSEAAMYGLAVQSTETGDKIVEAGEEGAKALEKTAEAAKDAADSTGEAAGKAKEYEVSLTDLALAAGASADKMSRFSAVVQHTAHVMAERGNFDQMGEAIANAVEQAAQLEAAMQRMSSNAGRGVEDLKIRLIELNGSEEEIAQARARREKLEIERQIKRNQLKAERLELEGKRDEAAVLHEENRLLQEQLRLLDQVHAAERAKREETRRAAEEQKRAGEQAEQAGGMAANAWSRAGKAAMEAAGMAASAHEQAAARSSAAWRETGDAAKQAGMSAGAFAPLAQQAHEQAAAGARRAWESVGQTAQAAQSGAYGMAPLAPPPKVSPASTAATRYDDTPRSESRRGETSRGEARSTDSGRAVQTTINIGGVLDVHDPATLETLARRLRPLLDDITRRSA